jgi:exonuclease SbcD
MRFVHLADTHLGASGPTRKVTPSGVNQREEDFCLAFSQAVDRILELKPDFVVHAGDLFHQVRPTNRILAFAARELRRLVAKRIPVVVISGNHDNPKQPHVGNVLSVLEILEGLHLVYRNSYEQVVVGETMIHAVPQCLDEENLRGEVDKAWPESKHRYNVLTVHGAVAGMREFEMGEISEQMIPDSLFRRGFDYVALGHYHLHCEVQKNVCYSGSTERLSFGELGQEKGFWEVDLETGEKVFHPLRIRPMIELETVDCTGRETDEITKTIESRIGENDIADKIVRLKVVNLPASSYRSLSLGEIRKMTEAALYFDLKMERAAEPGIPGAETAAIGKLSREFSDYLERQKLKGAEKERLLETGLKYILSAQKGEEE